MRSKRILVLAVGIALPITVFSSPIPVSNDNFETGSDNSSANSWDNPEGGVYFKSSEGFYNQKNANGIPTIQGRAASFESTGSACIQQKLADTFADTYDTYEVGFDLGYRCDLVRGKEIDAFRVYLWDPVADREVAGENIIIGQPWVNGDQSPNVASLVSRRVILQIDRAQQPHNPLLLCFANRHTEANPENAVAVLDNVSVRGTRQTVPNHGVGGSFSVSAWVWISGRGNAGIFWFGNNSSWEQLSSLPSIIPGKWNHVAGTFEKTGACDNGVQGIKRLYVNGAQVATGVVEHLEYGTDAMLLVDANAYRPGCRVDDADYVAECLASPEIVNAFTRGFGRYNKEASGGGFRIMTFNVHVGLDSNIANVGNVIKLSGADIVGIQEVYGRQVAELAAAADMPYYTFCFASQKAAGRLGNAILSKYPFLSNEQHPLYQSPLGEETRAFQVVKVFIGGKVYTVVNTHLMHDKPFRLAGLNVRPSRSMQADGIVNTLNANKGRILVLGDMNARAYHPSVDHFKQSFQDAWIIAEAKGFGENGYEGTPFNKHRIDHILFSHNHWDDTFSEISMLLVEGSDHYPIFADIIINPNPQGDTQ